MQERPMNKILFLTLFLSSPVFAVDLSKCEQDIKFEATGNPSALKIVGVDESKKGLSGNVERVKDDFKGEAIFDLKTLDTGISLRNKHMKEKYLKTDKYPTAKLSFPDRKLTLHGVTKEINPELHVLGGKVEAKFKINLADYKIDIPSFMEITVAKTVDVSVKLDCPL
jgi:hypothetical protein